MSHGSSGSEFYAEALLSGGNLNQAAVVKINLVGTIRGLRSNASSKLVLYTPRLLNDPELRVERYG